MSGNRRQNSDFEDIFSSRQRERSSNIDKYTDISSYSDYAESRSGAYGSRSGNYGYSSGKYDYEDDISGEYLDEIAGYQERKAGRSSKSRNTSVEFDDYYSDSHSKKGASGGKGKKSKKGKKKGRVKRIILFIVLLIIAALAAFGYYCFSLLDDINYVEAQRTNVYLDSSELYEDSSVTNILLLGIDTDENSTSRSDSMILVSVDRHNQKLKLTSFLRDSWVYIPDNGYSKLNAAYAYGGAGLVMDTIEYNFGIKIDNYMKVDYEVFKSIITDLGGVTVEVTEREADFINSTTRQTVDYGDAVKLNGEEALVYCRIRYLDSDFMRAYRQRKVLTAMKDELSSANVFTLLKVVQNVLPQVETDITKSEMASLGIGAVLKYRNYEMVEFRVPIDGSYSSDTINSQSVLSINFDVNKKALYDFVYNDADPKSYNG